MGIKVKIGKYTIESKTGFSSKKEAIQFIQDAYPILDVEDIEPYINSLINSNVDKPDNAFEADTEGGKTSSEPYSKRSEKPEIRKGK